MASIKEVKRTSGDWHVQSEEDIHLETQFASGNNGTVYVWGNLRVIGETTTIESNDLSISDKILVLNKGEPGLSNSTVPGVTGDGISGISVARGGSIIGINPTTGEPIYGSDSNANLVFNQNKTWSYAGITTQGMWEALIGTPTGGVGEPSGITISAIRTGATNRDLSLLGEENSGSTVTLSGVVGYRQRLVSRNNPDDIPNKAYVDYEIENQLDRRRLQLNFRNANQVMVQRATTNLEFVDTDVPGYTGITEPQLNLSIGGNSWTQFYNNRVRFGDILILDSNQITMETKDLKLVLSTSPGPGAAVKPSVEIKSSLSLEIDNFYQVPNFESTNIKLYAKAKAEGNTGLYFVNSEGIRDELPSKRRSFFASLML
jgi:hypothetical protein